MKLVHRYGELWLDDGNNRWSTPWKGKDTWPDFIVVGIATDQGFCMERLTHYCGDPTHNSKAKTKEFHWWKIPFVYVGPPVGQPLELVPYKGLEPLQDVEQLM